MSAIAAFGAALIAASEPEGMDYPEPPQAIADRIVDGRFEPGNFEYLRGYYPGADAEQVTRYQDMSKWLKECSELGRARLEAELAEQGLELIIDRYTSSAPSLCRQVFRAEQFERIGTYDELQVAAREARLVFATLVEAIRLAERRIRPIESDYARDLEARILGEQLLRLSFSWGTGAGDNPRLPQLSTDVKVVFDTLVVGELGRVDRENTEWLKGHIVERGWPRLSDVGEKASNAAWLLVQHADHDPVFQLRMLRLMEPLVDEDEVSNSNYAYLYDRVMLKLQGKQRYATQVMCEDGAYVAQPLEEEPERTDQLRAEMDLDTFAEYLKRFPDKC
uniref:DUF6624 domain-containing protein n=1 Tax=uncultured Altererythrobacter sp. TaxID=500840 RepID=UPI00261241F8|nr:DUF6624 domain-containing protein [uncultured Altererythrobacter sp.]